MSDKIKLILKYGEQRRSLFLNAHNKDDYGRHRGQVLYGMDLSGNGTIISVAAGAVYTSQGQRLFFDVADGEIDLGPSGIDAFDVSLRPQYPICVLIYLRYQFDTPQVAKAVEATSAVGLTSATLTARIVPFDRNTGAPAYNLLPRDPVTLDELQPSGYPSIQNWNDPSISALTTADKQADSIQFGEIPLGYVLIGTNPVTNAYPTNLTSSGVEIVSYKNAFEMVSDFIGVDLLVPRHDGRVVAGLVQSTSGTAKRQGLSANIVGSNTSPPLANPHYGTPENGASTTPVDSEFETYRQPNFFRDGDSLLEALRRIDVVLRQHVNRAGTQDLIGLYQDGENVNIPARATLSQILAYSSGSPTNAGTNLNSVTYDNGAVGIDPDNHALKNGLIPHVESSLVDKLGTNEGDSLKRAIEAVDVALSVVLSNYLGVAIPRSELRDVASTSSPEWDERPEGLPATAVNTVSGTATLPYLDDESFSEALTALAQRTLATPGTNWLANSGFWAGALSGNEAALPPYWGVTGGTATWTVTDKLAGGRAQAQFAISGAAGCILDQTIIAASANNFMGQLLSSASAISFSCLIGNPGATSIVVEVIGYSDTAGTTPVFGFTTAAIPASTAQRLFTATTKLSGATTVNHIKFRVRAVNGGDAWQATIGGACLNTGTPVNFHSANAATEFLSRDGGDRNQMRDDFYLGGFQAKNAADATDPQDLVPLEQMTDAIDAAIAASGVGSGSHVITASGAYSWEVPAGVTRVRVFMVGGGGAGGSGGRGVTGEGDDNGGGGGGGGGSGASSFYFSLDVTPGEDITGNIGTGGAPGGINASGVPMPGNPTTLTYDTFSLSVPGGFPGAHGGSNVSTGGVGGTGATPAAGAGAGGNGGKGGPGATNATAGSPGAGGYGAVGAAGAQGSGDSTERAGGGGGGGTPSGMGIHLDDDTPAIAGGAGGKGGDGDGGGGIPGVSGTAGAYGGGGGGGGGGSADNGGGGDETGKAGGPGGDGFVMFVWGV